MPEQLAPIPKRHPACGAHPGMTISAVDLPSAHDDQPSCTIVTPYTGSLFLLTSSTTSISTCIHCADRSTVPTSMYFKVTSSYFTQILPLRTVWNIIDSPRKSCVVDGPMCEIPPWNSNAYRSGSGPYTTEKPSPPVPPPTYTSNSIRHCHSAGRGGGRLKRSHPFLPPAFSTAASVSLSTPPSTYASPMMCSVSGAPSPPKASSIPTNVRSGRSADSFGATHSIVVKLVALVAATVSVAGTTVTSPNLHRSVELTL